MRTLTMLVILGIIILIAVGCTDQKAKEDYEKCASVCATITEDDYVELDICRKECGRQFLGDQTNAPSG